MDSRFTTPVELVLTSVHFPPASRKNDRDKQVSNFLNSYPKEAGLRMNKAFTVQAAKEARHNPVLHVVGGDWNVYPAAVPGVDISPWRTYVGSEVATSAGRQSFDHFVMNSEASNFFSICWDVVELQWLQNSAMGNIGLSDHSPIELKIQEMPRVVHR